MTIEERLESMERELGRQKRRNRWLLGAILLVAGGLIAPVFLKTTPLQAQAQVAGAVKELRANKISLVDETGKPRAALGVFNNGPYLTLYDENGKPRALMTVFKDGPSLNLVDENGKMRAVLNALKDGPCLGLGNENGEVRAALSMFEDGPHLALFDENGKTRAGLNVGKDGPHLNLYDENEKIRFMAGKTATTTPEGKTIAYPESSLVLFGPDGTAIWSAIK